MSTATLPTAPTVEVLPLDTLTIDKRYQRTTNENTVASMAAAFDPRMCPPLTVSERSNGTRVVFDGGHRLGALLIAGFSEYACWVHRGLTAKDESRLFVRMQTERRSMHPMDRHKAAVFHGDPTAVSVDNLVNEAGYRLTINKTYGALTCPVALYRAYERYGPDPLRVALRIIDEAWDRNDHLGRKASMIVGLALLIKRNPKMDVPALVEKLSEIKSAKIIRDSEMQGASHTTSQVRVAMQIAHIYNVRRTTNKIPVNFGRGE